MTYLQEIAHILGISSVNFYHDSDKNIEHHLILKAISTLKCLWKPFSASNPSF